MKKTLLLFALVISVIASFGQAGPVSSYSNGDYKKGISYKGGLYVGKLLGIGRFADTTAAAILANTGNAYSKPAREGMFLYDSTNDKLFMYRGDSLKFIEMGMVTITEATINFGSQAAQTSGDSTVSVPWARVGDPVSVSVTTAAVNLANTSYTAFVSAAGVVTVRLNNYSSSAKDPASGVFRIAVIKN